MEKIKQNPIVKKIGINRIVLCGVLLLMYAVFCILSDKFVGIQRIMSALNYAYFLGFLSLGVTFVIATGGIDFSIGPVMFCSALISGYCLTSYGVPMALSLVISVLVGTLFGVFNGYFVSYWTVPPFIISMASMNKRLVPIPPMEVQSEIVRILDNFTELTAELTAEQIGRASCRERVCTDV